MKRLLPLFLTTLFYVCRGNPADLHCYATSQHVWNVAYVSSETDFHSTRATIAAQPDELTEMQRIEYIEDRMTNLENDLFLMKGKK